jgi:hypothetical protein
MGECHSIEIGFYPLNFTPGDADRKCQCHDQRIGINDMNEGIMALTTDPVQQRLYCDSKIPEPGRKGPVLPRPKPVRLKHASSTVQGFQAHPLEVDQMFAIGTATDTPLDMLKCGPRPRRSSAVAVRPSLSASG